MPVVTIDGTVNPWQRHGVRERRASGGCMGFNPEIHHRRSIRLQYYDYAKSGAYFVTICSHQREHVFGKIENGEMQLSEFGILIQNAWDELSNHFPNVTTDEFVIMPNHMHGIIWIGENNVGAPLAGAQPMMNAQVPSGRAFNIGWAGARPAPTLGDIVGAFKSVTTVAYIRYQKDIDPNSVLPKLWQRNYYEHVIRSDAEFHRIRNYIHENPSKWESDPENA